MKRLGTRQELANNHSSRGGLVCALTCLRLKGQLSHPHNEPLCYPTLLGAGLLIGIVRSKQNTKKGTRLSPFDATRDDN